MVHDFLPPLQQRSARITTTLIVSVLALLLVTVTGCAVTHPLEPKTMTSQPAAAPTKPLDTAALEQYRIRVARHILERNSSLVLHGTPQAPLRGGGGVHRER